MVAKLTDVAALAGVSPATVSRVINQKGYLSQQTIEKVHAAMRALNYQPNNLARSLQGKSSQLVGVIFPRIDHPFFAELVSHLERELFFKGYKAILCSSALDPDKEREYLQMLMANQVDGIISGSHTLDIEDYHRVSAPIVSFDRNLSPDIPVVSSDNHEGGRLAAQFLRDAGCRHPLILSGADNSDSPTTLRTVGFRTLYPQAPVLHLPSHLSIQEKQAAFQNHEGHTLVDGIFATDDLTALAIAQLWSNQQRKTLPLVGYDGTQLIRDYHPTLTTIQQPIADLARRLVQVLVAQIQQTPCDTLLEPLPVQLQAGRRVSL